MNLDQITKVAFGRLLERLGAAYQHRVPERWKATTLDAYFDQIRRFDTAVVEQAIEDLIREPLKYFPKANQVLGACLAVERARRKPAVDQAVATACPACRTAFTWQSWLATRRSRGDQRPTVLEIATTAGPIVALVRATRNICACGFAAVVASRTNLELQAMAREDNAEVILAEVQRRAVEAQRLPSVPEDQPKTPKRSAADLEARRQQWRAALTTESPQPTLV